ncbi:4'-phosphopantetheinyl transferase superfamily protein [Archangium minus]|uniref:Enterobactin synthase component D n=1 Tax=Archangium minus TaxID=83450 RepID=A0ABY9WL89_9BACT|nr:4'-phosphopantetheinyl transferase superfamily protein [Archangium minus]
MSVGVRRPDRLLLPNGREVVLGWGAVGQEEDSALSPLEREGLARCRTDKRRREFVAGRLAAHRALALLEPGLRAEVTVREDGWPDSGRPLFSPEQGLALSISHSAGLAVAGVARGGPLGVDLEGRVEASEAFLEEAFAPDEREGYFAVCEGGMDPTTAAWAMKEAVLKVWGVGLRAPLQKVAVRPVRLHVSENQVSLRLTLETWELPPGLGEPPETLAALLVEWPPGGALAIAG